MKKRWTSQGTVRLKCPSDGRVWEFGSFWNLTVQQVSKGPSLPLSLFDYFFFLIIEIIG